LPPVNLTEPFEMEIDLKDNLKVFYVRMNGNTGGAGGFYEGVKRGYEKGYDWLWLMDDDAEPYIDSLDLLSNHFENQSIVGLAGTVVRPDNSIALNHRGKVDYANMFPQIQKPLEEKEYKNSICDIDTASFVGILVRSEAVQKIGYPIKEYFIHNDDIEYCLRLLNVGEIKLIPKSKILHKEASQKPIEGRIPLTKLWLQYYGIRNLISISRKYSTNKIKLYYQIFLSLFRPIIAIILKDNDKLKRIYFVLARVIDGFRDNFDNEKPKKILGLK